MVCIYCGSATRVSNSRHQKRTNSVWRRRSCQSCGAVFSTSEAADYEKSWLVQAPAGQPAAFLRDALFISIYKSCQHRPTALGDAIGLTATVLAGLLEHERQADHGTINRADIAELTYQALVRFDAAAATYYKAYHADRLG